MDQQKAKLRDMLSDVRQKCQDETQMVSSARVQMGRELYKSFSNLETQCGASCWFDRVVGQIIWRNVHTFGT